MNDRKKKIYSGALLVSTLLAAAFFCLSLIAERMEGKAERVARNAGTKAEKRLEILDEYIGLAMETDTDEHLCLEGLPEDMVIYKYVNDSLLSWSNQFSVLNDDISNKMVFRRLTDLKSRIVSPLNNVTDTLAFMNLGPKWYLVKSTSGPNNERIISGLEICNTLIGDVRINENGSNPRLKIPGQFSITPLSTSGGAPVSINGEPMFKILYDSPSAALFNDSIVLKWLSMLFVCLAVILFLGRYRTFRAYILAICMLSFLFALSYIWGTRMSETSAFFSPSTYANGPMLFSLGALILLNSYITMMSLCSYMMRDTFLKALQSKKPGRKRRLHIYGTAVVLTAAALFAYMHITLNSLLLNSNISLELYKWNTNYIDTAIAYASYIGLVFCVLLHLQMLAPVLRELFGIRANMLSGKSLLAFALCAAAYFTFTVSFVGFQREVERVSVWANRLAVDRDLGLEIRLRSIEDDIAADPIISSLSSLNNAEGLITNRISENFLARIRQDYNLNLVLIKDHNSPHSRHFNELLSSGTPVAEGSRFVFVSDGVGHSSYIGSFLYYSKDKGIIRMILVIEPNSNSENRGYYSILGRFSSPNEVNIPQMYSYAKYAEGRLTSYKGNFPYPTIPGRFDFSAEKAVVMRADGFAHFIHRISPTELIVISRPQTNGIVFFTSFSYLFLIIWGLVMIFHQGRKKRSGFKRNFFRTRINSILFVSSAMILASMTVISIFFVYKRNGENMRNMMSSRISTVQALVGNSAKGASSYRDMMTPEVRGRIENISKTTKSDITLYTPDGKVFYSSTPEVFDKMILGNRMNREAFHNIRHLHQRFYIAKEQASDLGYWMLYAPIMNSSGDIVAIASVPYTRGDHDFRREAFFHAALLINIFLLLLIISLVFSTREVNEMFTPLVEMGKKMNITDIHNLEPIRYHREDEISSLVEAYNRMVKELSDSTIRLAQAERDKAWSQMARQVAHEIKNPLTPIKLEIQRLIRLKQNGNPKWEEKFDMVSSVVLEHIDILTETANEFSTFAKLYTEEPVLMDLDKVLREQLMIFDNKENIRIDYIGTKEAFVMAPRPQLIRVFVNLITNAIQAVEIRQKEAVENGEEPIAGNVLIALRNSTKDGFFDIVIDDNGPGVKEENLGKLFTPNFTTKSGGTGLGLAICRNIIEKCDGTISYSRSFGLGGASFTVTLPKLDK